MTVENELKNDVKQLIGLSSVTSKQIVNKLKAKYKGLSDVQIREVVADLRDEGTPICADSSGYRLASTVQDLQDSIDSLRNRAMAIMQASNALERIRVSASTSRTGKLFYDDQNQIITK